MKIGCFSELGPVVGQELGQLLGRCRGDSGEYISQVGDRVDLILCARGQEGKVNRSSLAADIGTHEKAVFTHEHEGFDSLLSQIIVNVEVGILQKPGQRNPVIQRVLDGEQKRARRIECPFQGVDLPSEFFDQGLRAASPGSQSLSRRAVLELSLYIVELLVDVENVIARDRRHRKAIEIFPARVGVAPISPGGAKNANADRRRLA